MLRWHPVRYITMYNDYAKTLDDLRQTDMLRSLAPMSRCQGGRVTCRGREMLNLSSNDYLGLASDDEMLREFLEGWNPEAPPGTQLTDFGLSSSSSRLLTGNHPHLDRLEAIIAGHYGHDRAALLFGSGYHANLGILPALATREDLILCDRLNHASIIDGVRLARSRLIRYRHLDYDDLSQTLQRLGREKYRRVFIVTESIFSMDGDVADLRRLAEIRREYDAMLYVDEAHAVGVRGRRGLGICEEQGVIDQVDVLVGTLGKALASHGAFAVLDPVLREYLINTARPLIFATALPPITAHWTAMVFERMVGMTDRRAALDTLARRFRQAIRRDDREVSESAGSHIIPHIVGDAARTVELASRLQQRGYLVLPIRPPTVPVGTARLRFSLTANLTWDDIAEVPELL